MQFYGFDETNKMLISRSYFSILWKCLYILADIKINMIDIYNILELKDYVLDHLALIILISVGLGCFTQSGNYLGLIALILKYTTLILK